MCLLQVYKEQIHKRMPGAASAADTATATFPVLSDWLASEATPTVAAETFTRVLVTDLKRDILEQFEVDAAKNVCRQLAHLYHYYLHGVDGNVRGALLALTLFVAKAEEMLLCMPCMRM